MGDSWFGSVKATEAIALDGNHGIFVIKMNHSRSPKKWLEEKMADFWAEHGSFWRGRQRNMQTFSAVYI